MTLARLNRTLTYDAASRILYYDHTGTNHGNFQLNLAYDNLDRLTTTSGRGQQTYTYDLNGNRTQSLFGSSTYTNTVAATSNRMTAATGPSPAKTYQFDAAGNIISDGTNTYSYSDRGRLASATTAAGTFAYKYNGFGQRVLKTGPSPVIATGSNSYFYDEAGHLIGEYDASNKVIEETVYLGNTPIAVLTQATGGSPAVTTTLVYNVYADHLNSPVVITRTSDNQMVWRWDRYADAYGMSGPNQNPASLGTFVYNQRFAGQIFDKETNLNHNGFRDYDPVTGRYLQSDPIGLKGGFNTYAYVGANPVRWTDRLGLEQGKDHEVDLCSPFSGCHEEHQHQYDTGHEQIENDLKKLDENAPFAGIPGIGRSTNTGLNGPACPAVSPVQWPPNRGFSGSPNPASLLPGTRVDRYGAPTGTFVAPEGTPFSQRSLPDAALDKPYNSYEVLRPFEVDAGTAAPWFGQPGGGDQFELRNSVQDMINSGYLKKVK